VAGHQGQAEDQLVLDQGQGIKVSADDQHIRIGRFVQRLGGGFIGHKKKIPLGAHAFQHRGEATLALHRQINLGLQDQTDLGTATSHGHHAPLQLPAHRATVHTGSRELLLQQAGPVGQSPLALQQGACLRKGLDVQVAGVEGLVHDPSVRESPPMTACAPPLPRTVVLGSTSRYRRELLARLNLPFEVAAPDVDETPQPGEAPRALALRLALAKARAVAARHPEAVVIGSDQVADLAGQPLGKPGTHERAVQQLRRMRGQSVVFQTALAVVCLATGFEQVDLAAVRVQFRDLTDSEIENYLLAEKPYDCAGSAKSEGLGIALLESIDNDDPTALVGLPLIRTARMLRAAGVKLL